MSVVCQTGKQNGWIVKIHPVAASIPEYNVSLQDPVNAVLFTGNCGNPRSLQVRKLEEVYDVDVIVEVSDSTVSNAKSSTTLWISVAVSGFVFVTFIALVAMRTKNYRRTRSITKVNHVNPLNQVPVIVPWANSSNLWSLRDTLPTARRDFTPIQTRRSLL